jgi:hypothetical protein
VTISPEPPPFIFGQSIAPDYWLPLFDATLPEDARFLLFYQWATSYFHHENLEKQDTLALELSRFVPATGHIHTIFKHSPNESRSFLSESTTAFDE